MALASPRNVLPRSLAVLVPPAGGIRSRWRPKADTPRVRSGLGHVLEGASL